MGEQKEQTSATGACLCGGVQYKISGRLLGVFACHCEQCRRTSGNFVAAASIKSSDLTITNDKSLRWFKSSDAAKRGFCANCGSSLFWQPVDSPYVSIMAGTIDPPTGLKLKGHIFTTYASDYYPFDDDLPKFPEGYQAPS